MLNGMFILALGLEFQRVDQIGHDIGDEGLVFRGGNLLLGEKQCLESLEYRL